MKRVTAIVLLLAMLCGCSANHHIEKAIEVVSKSATEKTYEVSNNQEDIEEIEIAELQEIIAGTVTYVIDGDTFVFKDDAGVEYKVRMIGIDTPESVHRDKSKNTEEGKIASQFTKEQLEGKTVNLEFDVQTEDQYGRLLAYVWLGGELFNKRLYDEGYAELMTIPPNVKYIDYFLGED